MKHSRDAVRTGFITLVLPDLLVDATACSQPLYGSVAESGLRRYPGKVEEGVTSLAGSNPVASASLRGLKTRASRNDGIRQTC